MLALREEAAEENNLYSNCIQYLHHQETRKLELKHFEWEYIVYNQLLLDRKSENKREWSRKLVTYLESAVPASEHQETLSLQGEWQNRIEQTGSGDTIRAVIFKDYIQSSALEFVTSCNSLMSAVDAVIDSISEKVMFLS